MHREFLGEAGICPSQAIQHEQVAIQKITEYIASKKQAALTGRVRIAVRSMKSQSKVEMLTLPDSSRDSPLAKQKNC